MDKQTVKTTDFGFPGKKENVEKRKRRENKAHISSLR